jgi:hypothetical protein
VKPAGKNYYVRPPGNAPKGCPEWNTHAGEWHPASTLDTARQAYIVPGTHAVKIRMDDPQDDLFVEQWLPAHWDTPKLVKSKTNDARCCRLLFKDGVKASAARLSSRKSFHGALSEHATRCVHCDAVLFKAECVKSNRPDTKGQTRGRYCCADGDITLPAIKVSTVIKNLWCEYENPLTKLLHKCSRQVNNSFALACELYGTKSQRELRKRNKQRDAASGKSQYQPSVMIQGKLYHTLATLTQPDGADRAFAQLYVHDPNADTDVSACDERLKTMKLPHDVVSNSTAMDYLRELFGIIETALRNENPYVRDFVTAGEFMASRPNDIDDYTFHIDATERPSGAPAGSYIKPTPGPFSEVSVLVVDPTGADKAPQRAVMVRCRNGAHHIVDETHRSFDVCHAFNLHS